MGIAEEVEKWLQQIQSTGDFEKEFDALLQIVVPTREYPRLRYKPAWRWFRKCHRCHFCQRNSKPEFKAAEHICMRDSTLVTIRWEPHPIRWDK